MLPAIAWGASAVKTLGGAGTYTGVTSVGTGTTGAKTGTRVLRAGSVRTAPAVKAVSATTKSNNNVVTAAKSSTGTTSGNSQNRMSIGKYLGGISGGTAISSGSSSSGAKTSELEKDVQDLYDKLEDLEKAGYITSEEMDEYLQGLDNYLTAEDLADYVKSTDLHLDNYLTAEDLSKYGYITEEALTNLDDYLTKEELSNYGYVTSGDLDNYIKEDTLSTKVASTVTDMGVVTNDNLIPQLKTYKYMTRSDLDDYAETKELANKAFVERIVNRIQVAADMNPDCEETGTCLYMLSKTATDTGGTWQQVSVANADSFNPDNLEEN